MSTLEIQQMDNAQTHGPWREGEAVHKGGEVTFSVEIE